MPSDKLNVFFMPSVDWDLSNYLHYVAPDSQHNGSNWKVAAGDEVEQGQAIFELEYADLASVSEGFFGSFLQLIGILPRPAKGNFILNCPVQGTLHRESGFYGDGPYIYDFDKIDLNSSNGTLKGMRYSFHVFTSSEAVIFPYSYYKPWFDFIAKNSVWIENSIRHWSDDEGVQKWQRLLDSQKRRFQAIPCKIVTHERFMELQRDLWAGQPNKPDWL